MVDVGWDDASALLDDAVDERLGDRIDYAANGVTFVATPGFVLFELRSPHDLASIDEVMDARPFIKIQIARLPYPDPAHRLRHPKLGAFTFRPAGAVAATPQGRYWRFDIEKV